jgi:hypothetical protein
MIGHMQFEFHQFKERLEEALRLTASQDVNGPDCRHSFNRQVGISRRSAPLSGQFIGRPALDGLGTDPDGESSPLFERGVILAPVVDAVRGLLFHRKKSIQRHCIRNSSLRFVQQSLFFSQPEVLLFHLFIIEAMQQIIKQLS